MSTAFSTRLLLPFLVAFSVLVFLSQAFVIPSTTRCSTHQRRNDEVPSPFNLSPREGYSVSLSAKKRRRRKKNSDKPSPSNTEQEEVSEISSVSEPVAEESNELPDFDMDEEDAAEEEARRSKINPSEITENMMASGMSPNTRTLDDLITDRSLESKFEFEEIADPSIPDFVDLASASSTTPTYSPDSTGIGKKKQRQAERVAKAIERAEAEAPIVPLYKKLFPQLLDEKGKLSEVKVLENGAWVGIYVLIAWEVYINSPFFDRAAPLAPVVFEIVMKQL